MLYALLMAIVESPNSKLGLSAVIGWNAYFCLADAR